MALTLSLETRNAACYAVASLATGGQLIFRDPDGNAIATFDLDSPAFDLPEDGRAMARGLPMTAIATKAAGRGRAVTWYEVIGADGARLWIGSITEPKGGGDLLLDSTALVSGQAVTLTDWTHTQP